MYNKRDFQEFSEAGIRDFEAQNGPFVGVSCHDWSGPIVESVLNEWLNNPHNISHVRDTCNYDPATLAAEVVTRKTENDFSWSNVVKIIEISSDNRMTHEIYTIFTERHNNARYKFTSCGVARTLKCEVRDMARTVLWIEVLTYLSFKGFDAILAKTKI